MKVDATDIAPDLIEAYVVESFETCAGNSAHSMIGNKKVFLPTHENALAFSEVLVGEVGPSGLLSQWTPFRKSIPMLHIDFLVGTPLGVAGLKGVFRTNDFAFEVGGQSRVILCQA